jgi:hypothetical protein
MDMLKFNDSRRCGASRIPVADLVRVGLTGGLLAVTLSRPAAGQTLIAGSAGSGINAFYFALDFRDFSAPQNYAFEYRSNSTSLFFADILQGLAAVPTFSTRIGDGGSFGLSLNGIAFAGKEKFNDFNGSNSGEPNGYWSQWNSPNGTDWAANELGISAQTVTAGQWAGASWTANYLTVTDAAPRVPLAATAAAPEPGTLTLLAVGAISGAGIVLRRRKTAGK